MLKRCRYSHTNSTGFGSRVFSFPSFIGHFRLYKAEKVFGRDADVFQDLAKQSSANVTAAVFWNSCYPAVGVPEENMRRFV